MMFFNRCNLISLSNVIVESKNKPVGIVTERDIDKFLENDKTSRALEEISIEQIMEKKNYYDN